MNKTTLICLLAALLLSACAERMVCPAYQSALILDDDYRKDFFSPFTVDAGDTVPKDGYIGQRYKDIAKEKQGFTYNRKKKLFKARIWSRPERPVLQNPYLLGKIFRKRPYWKLDILKPEIVHYSNIDTIDLDIPTLYDSLGQPIPDTTGVKLTNASYTLLTKPAEKYRGYNIDQIIYNNKFGHLFPQPPPVPEPVDSATMQELLSDTTAMDSTAGKKKGIFGMFKKKKNKPPKPPKEKKKKDKKRKKKNEEGTKEEEEGG